MDGFFPLAGAVVAVGSAALLDKVRFMDFVRRREIERARDELKQLDRREVALHRERPPRAAHASDADAGARSRRCSGASSGSISELQRGYLRTMHSNGLRLLKLINNLLDLAKIEGKQLSIVRRPSAIGRLSMS